MINMKSCSAAFLVMFLCMEIQLVMSKQTEDGYETYDLANTYKVLEPNKGTGQQRFECGVTNACNHNILQCPKECPERIPKNKKNKGCFVNCRSFCETSCRTRKSNCEGFGAVCLDPRFIGGDGRMFYFHGTKGGNYALFSDDDIHVNAHFIGNRPEGRTRDYTWVQALSVIFDTHTLVIAAKKVSKWDDNVDALIVRWDDEAVEVPMYGDSWHTITKEGKKVIIERTDDTNNVKVFIRGVLELNVKVTPIGAEENRVHNYQLPSNDAFAHLDTEFVFVKLTDLAEGVLGKTYRPDYVSPVKTGVAMPVMGGEDKYSTPSFLSPTCKVCRFKGVQYEINLAKSIE